MWTILYLERKNIMITYIHENEKEIVVFHFSPWVCGDVK